MIDLDAVCLNTFGDAARNWDFMRKIRNVLQVQKMDPVQSVRRLRYEVMEVVGGNPIKTIHIGRTPTGVAAVERPTLPTGTVLKLVPINRGDNAS